VHFRLGPTRWNFGILQRDRPSIAANPHLPFATTHECSFRHASRSPVATSPAWCPAHWLPNELHDARRTARELGRSCAAWMYSVHVQHHHPFQTMSMPNGGIGNGIMDSATIDPSALNAAGTSVIPRVVALHNPITKRRALSQ